MDGEDPDAEGRPLLRAGSSTAGVGSSSDDATSDTSRTARLLSSISNVYEKVGKQGVRETFYCHICFENVPRDQGYQLEACNHRFCRDCNEGGCGGLKSYVSHKISEGQIYMRCFHNSGSMPCRVEFTTRDIQVTLCPTQTP